MLRPATLVALAVTALATAPGGPAIWLTYHPPQGVTYHARTIVTTRLEGEVHSGPPTDYVRTVYFSTTAMVDTSKVPWLSVAIDSVAEVRGGVGTGTLGSTRAALFVWASPFDERRNITTDTSDIRVRRAHDIFDPPVLDGEVPFPLDSIRQGDSWKVPVAIRFVGLRDSLGTLHGTAKVKVKSIIASGVSDGAGPSVDTTITLEIHYSLGGSESYSEDIHQGAKIYGSLDGTEHFSLTRGVTRSLDIQGKLSYEFDIGPGNRPTTPFDVEWHRTLLNDH